MAWVIKCTGSLEDKFSFYAEEIATPVVALSMVIQAGPEILWYLKTMSSLYFKICQTKYYKHIHITLLANI